MPTPTATQIIDQMMARDAFSQWLGIQRVAEHPGYCQLQMEVRTDMLNGFGIAHGGITFSLADSALAFASNSQGRHALSIDTGINHLGPVGVGDVLTATAKEQHLGHRLGHYQVEVHQQGGQLVALFKGVVFRKDTEWAAKPV
jgi:acyl-CoA thioesterase